MNAKILDTVNPKEMRSIRVMQRFLAIAGYSNESLRDLENIDFYERS